MDKKMANITEEELEFLQKKLAELEGKVKDRDERIYSLEGELKGYKLLKEQLDVNILSWIYRYDAECQMITRRDDTISKLENELKQLKEELEELNKDYEFTCRFDERNNIEITVDWGSKLNDFKALPTSEQCMVVEKEICEQLSLEMEGEDIFTTNNEDINADAWSTVHNYIDDLIEEGRAIIPKRP